jgi:hypothetical protein
MSIIFKSQKNFSRKQILYEKTRNKDDNNDTEKYNNFEVKCLIKCLVFLGIFK